MKTLVQMQQDELRAGPGMVDAREMLRLELLTSLEKFVKTFFKQQYGRTFQVNSHHKKIFEALQDVVDGKCKRLIINIAPRFSKTEVVVKGFIPWAFALNPKCKFMQLSYSDALVKDNAETVKSVMSLDLYKDLFPGSAPISEKGGSSYWKTKSGGEIYSASTYSQVTGRGAGAMDLTEADLAGLPDPFEGFDEKTRDVMDMIGARLNIFNGAIILDDPLKAGDADSDILRERVNFRFENTIRSRVNSRNTPIIIIMQRLHEHDLCGYLQEVEPDTWRVLSMPAIQTDPETGEEYSLWPQKLTLDDLYRMRRINPIVFERQYQQNPTPKEGLMYSDFYTYSPGELPAGRDALQRWCYVDTADTGADYLCAICFINTPTRVYVTDVLYTQEPMEKTEMQLAKMLTSNNTSDCLIESNNGGRQFARSVKAIVRTKLRNFKTVIHTFTQTKNKASRIFSNSALVNSDVAFPEGWEKRWKDFYAAIVTYSKDNKRRSVHDDAPDALTGVIEMRTRRDGRKKIYRRN